MKTAELTGAYLDYWTGVADGKDREKLSIRRVPRTDTLICVYNGIVRYDPSTNAEKVIDLMDRHHIGVTETADKVGNFRWCSGRKTIGNKAVMACGATIPIAICRMVVFVVFGDEVLDIEITE